MQIRETVSKLLSAPLADTETVGVSYERSESFDPLGKPFRFYRVICQSSYETGSEVRSEIWLPEDWNGRYLGLGNGGLAGLIRHGQLLAYARLGFAVALTDMGTQNGAARGIGCPAVWRDFGWRATHGMTVLAKQLITLCYGRPPVYSYFFGSSTGGQQAMSLAQRFPNDYDGIIAGVPAQNRVALHTYFLWTYRQVKRPDGSNRFTEEEIRRLTACGVEFFGGVTHIDLPWKGDTTVTDFLAFLGEKGFSGEQLSALEAIYLGPVDGASGRQIYNGMPIGSEKIGGLLAYLGDACPHFYPFLWTFGGDFTPFDFDFERDYARLESTLSPELDANDPDLSAFAARGGRLLAFSGSADAVVPFPDAVRYYERVLSELGGYERVSHFYRYFLFPGKNHGSDGDGANREWGDESGETSLLDVLCAWVEEGRAPDCLYAARVEDGKTVFSTPIYPYASPSNPARRIMRTCETVP